MPRLEITKLLRISYNNTWTEQIQNHQDDLDWVVGVLWHQPHLLEAGHGGVRLGLLFVVHSDSGHIVSAVNNNLQTNMDN